MTRTTNLTPEKELASNIIDEFEELLDEKNISIPSRDRKGESNEARIYGEEYYALEDRITGMIVKSKGKLSWRGVRCPCCGSKNLEEVSNVDDYTSYGCLKCKTWFSIWNEEYESTGEEEVS